MNSAKKPVLDTAQLEELAGKVARQQTVEKGALAEVGGSYVYAVGEGWEANQLKQDAEILQVRSIMELDEALENTAFDTLLIPSDATMTLELLKTALARHCQQKTVFFEQRRPAPVE